MVKRQQAAALQKEVCTQGGKGGKRGLRERKWRVSLSEQKANSLEMPYD
jgi:hypothetical protein